MQTIEQMRERRDALVNVSRNWGRYHEFYTAAVALRANNLYRYCQREILRYGRLIADAAIAEGRQRGYRERTLAEATSDRAAAIERRNEREDHNPRRSPGETY